MACITRRALWLATGVALLAGGRPARAAEARTVMDLLAADGRFGRFIGLVQRASFSESLRGVGPFTLFAPTDAAFAGAPGALLRERGVREPGLREPGLGEPGPGEPGLGEPGLADDGPGRNGAAETARLRAFVQFHLLTGRAWSLQELAGGDRQLKMDNGAVLLVRGGGPQLLVTGPAAGAGQGGVSAVGGAVLPPAPLVQPDLRAGNGVVQVLGGLVTPA